jgi:hypothetical protein
MVSRHVKSAVPQYKNVTGCRCGGGKDMVPPASSSIEGVFAFVLSPDELQVLLVWEYGHWKVLFKTGNHHQKSQLCAARQRRGGSRRVGNHYRRERDNGGGDCVATTLRDM